MSHYLSKRSLGTLIFRDGAAHVLDQENISVTIDMQKNSEKHPKLCCAGHNSGEEVVHTDVQIMAWGPINVRFYFVSTCESCCTPSFSQIVSFEGIYEDTFITAMFGYMYRNLVSACMEAVLEHKTNTTC